MQKKKTKNTLKKPKHAKIPKSYKNDFKLNEAHANGRSKSQLCCVFLEIFGQQCCVRLIGPKSLAHFKLYARSANKCQHCCGSMKTDATCWAQQCCVLLANNVASVCMRL